MLARFHEPDRRTGSTEVKLTDGLEMVGLTGDHAPVRELHVYAYAGVIGVPNYFHTDCDQTIA